MAFFKDRPTFAENEPKLSGMFGVGSAQKQTPEQALADVPKSYPGFTPTPVAPTPAPAVKRPIISPTAPAVTPTPAAAPKPTDIDPWTGLPYGGVKVDSPAAPITDTTPAGGTIPTPRPTITPANPIADYYNSLNRTQPDEASIREQEFQRQQARIAAINSVYDEELNRAREVGRGRLGETRAMGAAMGVLGSSFGAAQKNQTEDANTAVERGINVERQAKIADVFNQIDQNTMARVQSDRARADKNSEAYIGFLKDSQEQARSSIKELAAGGVDFNTLSQEQKKKLVDSTGYDELTLESVYNASKKADRVKYDYQQLKDGSLIRTGDDGTFKNMGKYEAPNSDPAWKIESFADGTVAWVNPTTKQFETVGNYGKPQAEGKIVKIGGVDYVQNADGSFSIPNVPSQIGDITKQTAQFDFINTAIENAEKFADAAGRSTWKEALASGIFGATDFTKLENASDTIRTNFLTIASDPNVKKFFGPQMSNRDVELMLAGGTMLDPKRQDPEEYRDELTRIKDFVQRAKSAVINAQGQQSDVSDATEEEIQGLMKKNGMTRDQVLKGLGLTSDQSMSVNGSNEDPTAVTKKVGMRTDRHNNPTAFTTDVAKVAGLKEGVDYVTGDPFRAGTSTLYTARLIGDPIDTTIRVIDRIGFQTRSGNPRWSYINMPKSQWNAMNYDQKKAVIARMYGSEGGQKLNKLFA